MKMSERREERECKLNGCGEGDGRSLQDNACVKQKTNWDSDGQQQLCPRQGRDDM